MQTKLLRRQKWWSNWTVQNLYKENIFQIKFIYFESFIIEKLAKCIFCHHLLVLEIASSMHTTLLRDDSSCDICGRASEFLRSFFNENKYSIIIEFRQNYNL